MREIDEDEAEELEEKPLKSFLNRRYGVLTRLKKRKQDDAKRNIVDLTDSPERGHFEENVENGLNFDIFFHLFSPFCRETVSVLLS